MRCEDLMTVTITTIIATHQHKSAATQINSNNNQVKQKTAAQKAYDANRKRKAAQKVR